MNQRDLHGWRKKIFDKTYSFNEFEKEIISLKNKEIKEIFKYTDGAGHNLLFASIFNGSKSWIEGLFLLYQKYEIDLWLEDYSGHNFLDTLLTTNAEGGVPLFNKDFGPLISNTNWKEMCHNIINKGLMYLFMEVVTNNRINANNSSLESFIEFLNNDIKKKNIFIEVCSKELVKNLIGTGRYHSLNNILTKLDLNIMDLLSGEGLNGFSTPFDYFILNCAKSGPVIVVKDSGSRGFRYYDGNLSDYVYGRDLIEDWIKTKADKRGSLINILHAIESEKLNVGVIELALDLGLLTSSNDIVDHIKWIINDLPLNGEGSKALEIMRSRILLNDISDNLTTKVNKELTSKVANNKNKI